jgi:hypothetical protein
VELPPVREPETEAKSVAAPAKFAQIEAEYQQRIEDFFLVQGRYPSRKEDMGWGKGKLKRSTLKELRQKYIPAEVRKGGRPRAKKLGSK